ncbi:MAG: BCCT family transporter, partial [Bacteroidota bacterium]|nr:BCCT family transporter [Bacteroidota bacterium]
MFSKNAKSIPSDKGSLRPWVFWPPLLVCILGVSYSLIDVESMVEQATWLNTKVLNVLGPVYSLAVLLFLLICIVVYWSPLGRVRIGGQSAKPLLSKWRWYSITLTTT